MVCSLADSSNVASMLATVRSISLMAGLSPRNRKLLVMPSTRMTSSSFVPLMTIELLRRYRR